MNRPISSQVRSIGSFSVRRVLPTVKQRTLGPFVFLDHMGPVALPRRDLQVPPHPHIGLSTLTYLFDGSLEHRDSVGSQQAIESGAVNWMTAGRGIVHSERPLGPETDEKLHLHGLQAWVALPIEEESCDPSFRHYGSARIPRWNSEGVFYSLAVGEAKGRCSPVETSSPTLFVEIVFRESGSLEWRREHEEEGLYVVEGEVEVGTTRDGVETLEAGQLLVLEDGNELSIHGTSGARLVVLGGARLTERRFLDWNFCASDRTRIQEAKEKYRRGELGVIEGEEPQLPLPEDVR